MEIGKRGMPVYFPSKKRYDIQQRQFNAYQPKKNTLPHKLN